MLSFSPRNITARIAHHNGLTLKTNIVLETAMNFNENMKNRLFHIPIKTLRINITDPLVGNLNMFSSAPVKYQINPLIGASTKAMPTVVSNGFNFWFLLYKAYLIATCNIENDARFPIMHKTPSI